MPTEITGSPTKPASITTPIDGEPRNGAGLAVMVQDIADQIASERLGRQRQAVSSWIIGTPSGNTFAPNAVAGGLNKVLSGTRWWVVVGPRTGIRPSLLHTSDGQFLEDANGTFINRALEGVAYDSLNDVWIAVGEDDGTDAYILSTTDGPTQLWAERTNPRNFTLRAVASNAAGITVAAGVHDSTDIYAVRSTDGLDFSTEVSIPGVAGNQVNKIATSGTTWVAVGQDDPGVGGLPLIWRSTDSGATWAAQTVAAGSVKRIFSVTHNGKKFIAVGGVGEIQTSTDGAAWTLTRNPSTSPDDFDITGVASDPVSGLAVANAPGGVFGNYLLVSDDDGATWDRVRRSPKAVDNNDDWLVIAQDDGAWVLGLSLGSGNVMARSIALL